MPVSTHYQVACTEKISELSTAFPTLGSFRLGAPPLFRYIGPPQTRTRAFTRISRHSKAKDCWDGEEAQTHSQIRTEAPDLEQSKSAVLNSLPSVNSRQSYDHAICEFTDWYCLEPRLAFNKLLSCDIAFT